MKTYLLFVSLFFVCSSGTQAQTNNGRDIPTLNSPVNDRAQLLSLAEEAAINRVLEEVWKRNLAQIAILTVPSLEGNPIEQFAMQVVDNWQLGTRSDDNGLLILISTKDRGIRIEVGQGLEGFVTDAQAKRLIREVMAPLFRQNRYSEGLLLSTAQIVKWIDPQTDIQGLLSAQTKAKPKEGDAVSQLIIFLLFLFVIFIKSLVGFNLNRSRSYRNRTGWGYSDGYWGPSSRGGFKSGGFGGGGGGFSGGGASGGW